MVYSFKPSQADPKDAVAKIKAGLTKDKLQGVFISSNNLTFVAGVNTTLLHTAIEGFNASKPYMPARVLGTWLHGMQNQSCRPFKGCMIQQMLNRCMVPCHAATCCKQLHAFHDLQLLQLATTACWHADIITTPISCL